MYNISIRYTLKIYNIDFHNSNKMHELINYLEEIELAMNIFITNITSYLNNDNIEIGNPNEMNKSYDDDYYR